MIGPAADGESTDRFDATFEYGFLRESRNARVESQPKDQLEGHDQLLSVGPIRDRDIAGIDLLLEVVRLGHADTLKGYVEAV